MRLIAFRLVALAASALPASVSAQATPGAEAEEAFKCAIWASYFSAEYEGQPEADALAYALNYFVGRYEGLTGHGIDEHVDAELVTRTANGLDELTPMCTASMESYGSRMAEWGKLLEAIGERIPAAGAQS